MLDHDYLLRILHYGPETGVFTWIISRRGIRKDRVAGRTDGNGYRTICIDGHHYLAHRLAWFYMTGEWPKECVDHKNDINDDNRWDNLREATVRQNSGNIQKFKNKYKGICWDKRDKRWRASIKSTYLGNFIDPVDAAKAYDKAAIKYFGNYAYTNFKESG